MTTGESEQRKLRVAERRFDKAGWLTIRPPSPRVFAEMFILKALRVDCLYRFTKLLILKDLIALICTKIVQDAQVL